MTQPHSFVTKDMPLEEIYKTMKDTHTELIPVVDTMAEKEFNGVLSLHHVQAKVAHETLKRQGVK